MKDTNNFFTSFQGNVSGKGLWQLWSKFLRFLSDSFSKATLWAPLTLFWGGSQSFLILVSSDISFLKNKFRYLYLSHLIKQWLKKCRKTSIFKICGCFNLFIYLSHSKKLREMTSLISLFQNSEQLCNVNLTEPCWNCLLRMSAVREQETTDSNMHAFQNQWKTMAAWENKNMSHSALSEGWITKVSGFQKTQGVFSCVIFFQTCLFLFVLFEFVVMPQRKLKRAACRRQKEQHKNLPDDVN